MDCTILLGMLVENEDIEEIMKKELLKNGIDSNIIRKHTKMGVANELEKNTSINVLITVNSLESAYPYLSNEIEDLLDIRKDLTLIIILPNDKKGSTYVEQLYRCGLYTAIFDEDSTYAQIANLIKNGRKKREARIYYQISNDSSVNDVINDGVINTDKAKQIILYLQNANEGSLEEKLIHVKRMLDMNEFLSLLRLIPDDLKERVKVIPLFERYFLDEEVTLKKSVIKTNKLFDGLNKLKMFLNQPVVINKTRHKNKEQKSNLEKEDTKNEDNFTCQDSSVIKKVEDLALDKPTVIERLQVDIIEDSIDEEAKIDTVDNVYNTHSVKKKFFRDRTVKTLTQNCNMTNILDITVTIAVCSLQSGIGCTHITKTFVTYIKKKLKKSVAVVCFDKHINPNEEYGVPVYSKDKMYMLFEKYDYLIFDVGLYNHELHNEVKMATIKIMIALLNDNYLKMLYDFLKNESTTKWKYFFNHVPKNQLRKVSNLMEDYQFWCMPVYSPDDIDEDVEAMANRIFKGIQL